MIRLCIACLVCRSLFLFFVFAFPSLSNLVYTVVVDASHYSMPSSSFSFVRWFTELYHGVYILIRPVFGCSPLQHNGHGIWSAVDIWYVFNKSSITVLWHGLRAGPTVVAEVQGRHRAYISLRTCFWSGSTKRLTMSAVYVPLYPHIV